MSARVDYGEPWFDKTNTMGDTIDNRDGNIVAYGEGVLGDRDDMPDGSGYGRRIVACVNACRGLSTETLETFGGTVPNGIVYYLEQANRERDEARAMVKELEKALVEACEQFLSANGSAPPIEWRRAVIKARAIYG